MFSDDDIKEIPVSYMRPGDEIISIHEVCLADKLDRKDLGLHLLPSRNDLDSRSLFRDGFFPDGPEQAQARFAWTEEDGNIAALVSEPGFGTTGQTTFGTQIDAALKSEIKEADTSSPIVQPTNRSLSSKSLGDFVSSTSSRNPSSDSERSKRAAGACKVDKGDPRSRYHFVKYVKRHGRTVKLWECGICGREFQHQYTLMRHLPTHTDERNFHCDTCGKSFRQLSTLSQHRAIHSAARPYACEACKKTFNRVSTLISHRKTHSDEKPYKCHICPKGFHQKGNLRNHLFTHTNERPYRCNICFKGFNQQSNLVCHKNKAHKDGSAPVQRNLMSCDSRLVSEAKSEEARSQDHCEVSSSVGPYLSTESISLPAWHSLSSEPDWGLTSGVIVDPIKTYHMKVALATKQTPFALLKPNNGGPVLVKVVDTSLPGGKQMLVPATAADLRSGGKIVMNAENENNDSQDVDVEPSGNVDGAVQIRVPVVATVVPKISAGRLHLKVEEPHHSYHTALSADVAEVKKETCSINTNSQPQPSTSVTSQPRHIDLNTSFNKINLSKGPATSSNFTIPPATMSPPLDLIAMDLFEPMECMPLGPQITAVDDQSPPSDDSDVFIKKLEESIPLSDSD